MIAITSTDKMAAGLADVSLILRSALFLFKAIDEIIKRMWPEKKLPPTPPPELEPSPPPPPPPKNKKK